jgi:hypothetical protein
MQSSLIGKIEKANRYAQEPERIKFIELSVSFRGDNNNYVTSYKEGKWHCTCDFFQHSGTCSHTMAMEKILGEMIPENAITTASKPN